VVAEVDGAAGVAACVVAWVIVVAWVVVVVSSSEDERRACVDALWCAVAAEEPAEAERAAVPARARWPVIATVATALAAAAAMRARRAGWRREGVCGESMRS
jgi:hypothetical protein